MITRAHDATELRQAVIKDGLAICPECWRPLCEPMGGFGEVAVWCHKCRKNRLVKFKQIKRP